jgi:hypothetical protein
MSTTATTTRPSSGSLTRRSSSSIPIDTNGDGTFNAVGVDTTGDGHIDSILHIGESSTLEIDNAHSNLSPPPPPSIAVLFSQPLVSDGQALPILNCDLEFELLSKSIKESNRQITLNRAPATSDRLRTLLTLGVTVLHYIGHGAEEYIPFENNNGGMHKISQDHLRTLLSAGDGVAGLQLVFVNSCFSRMAGETFAECGVPHVVCLGGSSNNRGFLSDDCAVTFMRSFYLALCSGKTVKNSFDIGRASVKAMEDKWEGVNNEEQASMFTLLPLDSNHNEAIFQKAEVGSLPLAAGRRNNLDSRENLPSSPCNFSGRQFELYSLVDRVINNRLVTLSGGCGMGKSTLAISAGRYLYERKHFAAVTYVKVTSATTLYGDIHSRLRAMVPVFNEERYESETSSQYGGSTATNSRSLFEFREFEDERPVVDVSFLQKMKDEKVLLVLDGSEALIDSGALLQFRGLLRMLLTHTSQLKLIVTTSKNSVGRMTLTTESVLELAPLDNVEMSKMLMVKCPTLRRGFKHQQEFIDRVSKHAALRHLNGNPYAVGLLASLLQRLPEDGRNLDATQRLFENHIARQNDSDSDGDLSHEEENMEIKVLVDDIINIKGDEDEEDEAQAQLPAVVQTARRGTATSFDSSDGEFHSRLLGLGGGAPPPLRRRTTSSTAGQRERDLSPLKLVHAPSANSPTAPYATLSSSAGVPSDNSEKGSERGDYEFSRKSLYGEFKRMELRKKPALGVAVLVLWIWRLAANSGLWGDSTLARFLSDLMNFSHFLVDIVMLLLVHFLLPS